MKNTDLLYLLPALFLAVFGACKKEFDSPPARQIHESARISISKIKNRYNPRGIYKFKGDTNLYCVVVADEVSGNLYKEVYVRDASGGLHIKLLNSGGLFIGDSIRINLKEITLNSYAGLIQLDSIDIEKSVVKLASGLNPTAEMISLAQIVQSPAGNTELQSRFIKLSNVEFMEGQRERPYADVMTKAAVQYTLVDCAGNQIALRTSGFSAFANQLTPVGNGEVSAILSQFNNSFQLILRDHKEVSLNGPLCSANTPTVEPPQVYLLKNFEDGLIESGGWSNVNASGTVSWSVKSSTNSSNQTKLAECNNFVSAGNQPACESWLIGPGCDLSASASPNFSFTSASSFSGPQLQVLASSNYISGAPSTATWTVLYPTFGLSSTHTSSGKIDLAAFKKTNVRVAFKYTGNNGAGQRWQVDNIRISE